MERITKMIVLGIDTSTLLLSVGLSTPNGCMGEIRIHRGARHAEMLTRVIQDLLETSGIGLDELAGIAVAMGPGSFTGLRIGLGTAKGLAFGRDLPLVGVPSMQGYLYAIPQDVRQACMLIPSRKGEYYVGKYNRQAEGSPWVEAEPLLRLKTEQLPAHLPKEPCIYLGQGATDCRPLLSGRQGALLLPHPLGLASGYGIAVAGANRLSRGDHDDADTLIPMYHQAFQGVD